MASGRRATNVTARVIAYACVLIWLFPCVAAPKPGELEQRVSAELARLDASVTSVQIEFEVKSENSPARVRELSRRLDPDEVAPTHFGRRTHLREQRPRFYIRENRTDEPGAHFTEIAFDGLLVRTFRSACHCGNMLDAWSLETRLLPDHCWLGARLGDKHLRELIQEDQYSVRTSEEVETAGPEPAVELWFPDPDRRPLVKSAAGEYAARGIVTVDPNRGMVPVRIRNRWTGVDESGRDRWLETLDITAHTRSLNGAWYPTEAVRRVYGFLPMDDDPDSLEFVTVLTQRLSVEEIDFDVTFSCSDFRTEYPPGTKLLNDLTGQTYITGGLSEAGILTMLSRLQPEVAETIQGGAVRLVASPPTGAMANAGSEPIGHAPSSRSDIEQCGPFCLYTLSSILGIETSLHDLAVASGTDSTGTSMLGLVRAANTLGLNATGVRMTREELARASGPMILHLDVGGENAGHYVLAWPLNADEVVIFDYPKDPLIMSRDGIDPAAWQGLAVVFTDLPETSRDVSGVGPKLGGASHQEAGQASAATSPLEFSSRSAVLKTSEAEVSYHFDFRNVGSVPIRIEHISQSCECTSVQAFPLLLAPGEEGLVEVVVERNDEPEQSVGLSLLLSNGEVVDLALTLQAAEPPPSRPTVRFVPEALELEQLLSCEAEGMVVYLVAEERSATGFEISAIRSSNPMIEVAEIEPPEIPGRLVSGGEPRACRAIRVSVSKEAAGLLDALVQVETDLPHQPVVTLPVAVRFQTHD